jgi:hypothetical protein
MTRDLLMSAAAERNKDPILSVLESTLPEKGSVLEIASGTGQHVCYFAASLPGIDRMATHRAGRRESRRDRHAGA